MNANDLDDCLESCPYDESHRILKSRMQCHLVRCRRNHPCNKDQMMTCPYDALHVVNSIEFEYHIANCSKSGSVLNFMFTSEYQRDVGSVPLEALGQVQVPIPLENWDADPPVPSYDPLSVAQGRKVLLSNDLMSKAKKRNFKTSERIRIQTLAESGGAHSSQFQASAQKDASEPLRAPHKLSTPLSEGGSKSKEDLEPEDVEPKDSMRRPYKKSTALSVCSNTDDTEEMLNSSKLSTSSRPSDYPALTTNLSSQASGTDMDGAAISHSIVAEAVKTLNPSWSPPLDQDNASIEEDFVFPNKQEILPTEPRFLFSDMVRLNSKSSNRELKHEAEKSKTDTISTDPKEVSYSSRSDPGQSNIRPVLNPSSEVINELTVNLATVNILENSPESVDQNIQKEKQEKQQQMDDSCDGNRRQRCAANFSKPKD